jgi:hypothetical protein
MAHNLAASADRHWKTYQQVKAIVEQHEDTMPIGIVRDLEDYGADTIAYDVYSENPEQYVADEGQSRRAPLTPERRAQYKEAGFRFKRDGTVEYHQP